MRQDVALFVLLASVRATEVTRSDAAERGACGVGGSSGRYIMRSGIGARGTVGNTGVMHQPYVP